MTPTPQSPFSDRYRLERIIGRGGMGAVWLATDLLLGRPVAIKEVVLPATVTDDERRSAQARFAREANAAARVAHPAVVTLHDVVADGGRLLLVMEHVDGPSLELKVATDGPLTPADAAALGSRIAGALAAAHDRGVIHRDVKPSNILVPGAGSTAKLVDFGIAAIGDDPRITATGLVIGSPAYLAPEQAEGQAATPASDVFSLGASLYFAVEGVEAFRRDTSTATIAAVGAQPPREPLQAGPLGPLVLAMLEKDPGRRPSMPEAERRLAEVAGFQPPAAAGERRSPVLGPATRPLTALQQRPEPAKRPELRRHRKLPWVAAAGGLAVALGAAGAIVAARGDDDPQAGTTSTAAQVTTSEIQPTSTAAATPATTAQATPTTVARATTTTRPQQPPAVPAGFTQYVDPQGGFRMLVPEEFGLDLDADRQLTEFTDGYTAIVVRWYGPGIDPAGYLGREQRRYADLPRYKSIGLEQQPFGGHPGTTWMFEFAWNGNPDRLLRSVGRVFAVGEYTFGIWFRSPADEFPALRQRVFSVVERSFRPTVGASQGGG